MIAQHIAYESGKSQAKSEGRKVRDGDIRTACQEACPADAIVFGDLNDANSRVSKLSKHPRGFKSLEEVNAAPAITYLTKVRNRAPRHEGNGNGHHAEEHSPVKMKIGDICPECGEAAVVNEEGCRKCYACGFSEC